MGVPLARGQFKRGAMLRQQGTLFVLLTAWQAYAPTPSPPPGPPPPSQPGKGNTLVQEDGTLIDNSHVRVRARFSSRTPAVSTLLAQLGGQEGALFEGKPDSKEQKKMNMAVLIITMVGVPTIVLLPCIICLGWFCTKGRTYMEEHNIHDPLELCCGPKRICCNSGYGSSSLASSDDA